ncbi:MAG: hypothetical protein QM756_00815 [Polyangiaceae bacterium]
MLEYHRVMRAALLVRRRLGARARPGAEQVARVATELAAEVQAEFVQRVADPPSGRLNQLVFGLISARRGRPASELESMLFRGEPLE